MGLPHSRPSGAASGLPPAATPLEFSVRCDDVTDHLLRRVREAHRSGALRRVTLDCRASGFDAHEVDRVQEACAVTKIVLHM